MQMKGFIIIIKDERISFKNQFESKDSLWNSIQIKGFIIIGFIIIIKKIMGFQFKMKGFPSKSNLN